MCYKNRTFSRANDMACTCRGVLFKFVMTLKRCAVRHASRAGRQYTTQAGGKLSGPPASPQQEGPQPRGEQR